MAGPGEARVEEAQPAVAGAALDALATAASTLAEGEHGADNVGVVVEAAARVTRSDVAVARAVDATGALVARAVAGPSPAVAAELEGSRFALEEAPRQEVDDREALPIAVRRAAERLGAHAVLYIPIAVGGRLLGSLELLRRGPPFSRFERGVARIAAAQIALALQAGGLGNGIPTADADHVLRAVGDALAAGADGGRIAEQVVLFAADSTGAETCLLWGVDDAELVLLATYGARPAAGALDVARAAAERALELRRVFTVDSGATTIRLGEPPLGALQLFFADDSTPGDELVESLATFGARAAQALRAGDRSRRQSTELEQTRALLGAVAQAIAQLSLAHTLETSIDRVADLLGSDRLAVYLLEPGENRLLASAGHGLAGPHVLVAERLLEIALVGSRTGLLVVGDLAADRRLSSVRDAVAESGIEAAVAVPLVAHDEVIGLLAAYPTRDQAIPDETATLVEALAAQLAVAVQNARLHEQAKRLGAEREQALDAERDAARRLGALYEISRSFAHSLSLEATLDAVVRTVAELLDLDAVGMRMPDSRTESLTLRALHVRDERMEGAVRAVLGRPQPLGPALRRLFGGGRPIVLEPATSRTFGGAYALLVPFLEKGSTAAIVPVSTQSEVLGTLTLLSLDPARPIGSDAVDLALSVAGHAALALDNARLYQQQKEFTESMQRSLLPDAGPEIDGLDVGAVYASSARVDVGGDVYDFLPLGGAKLAVVLGDVTGHGVDAAADMAMAKFVFRSLGRRHPDPAAFLHAANDVVVEEIGASKFITMVYLTIDALTGALACAVAGHPPPRIVSADGVVTTLPASGLALGVDDDQDYERVEATLEPGDAVVLYTDGVIEARRRGELYGSERFDALLATNAALSPDELAAAVVADARAFAGADLSDDCAVVVIRRTT